jgi:DENN domain-containing protein 4
VTRREEIPTFFAFVHTRANGQHMFGFCLTFYEKLAADRRFELQAACDEWEKLYRSVCDAPAAAVQPLAVDTPMYTPKCLCLLSSWPYFTSYREWLTNLFLISLSPAAVPIERYICNFMLEVPNAVPGRSVSTYHYISADKASKYCNCVVCHVIAVNS